MGFFDDAGLLNPAPDERSTNGILYLAYFITLQRMNNRVDMGMVKNFISACSVMDVNGEYPQTPWTTIEIDRASHDNMTGIACVSYAFGMSFHKRIKISKYPHPRDLIFYGLLKGSLWAKISMPLLSLILIYSCWTSPIAKNGLPDTDGKLLSFLRFKSYHMPITEWICNKGMKRVFGEHYLLKMFSIYFNQYPEHPIRLEAMDHEYKLA